MRQLVLSGQRARYMHFLDFQVPISWQGLSVVCMLCDGMGRDI
jgi:hypothetical protein